MATRRNFLKDVAALIGVSGAYPAIQRAAAITPDAGSSFLDAEHVVILMQENRSFDHAFGSMRGVRGFHDPRAVRLENGNPVWAQSSPAGDTFVPFRLDIRKSRTTWMGSLPHSWVDQVDAANGGKHDRWLSAKASGHREYASMPLTLGYHTREDLPFYYALADAFTVCDQNFCSTLTGTTPNRMHLWSGTIRERPDPRTPAYVRNEDTDYHKWCHWTTFPERLEDHGVSWAIYQNELSLPTGLEGEHDAWLSNFTDNPIEWFEQYHVRFHPAYRTYLGRRLAELPNEIDACSKQLEGATGRAAETLRKKRSGLEETLVRYRSDYETFTPQAFAKLPERERSLFRRAFTTNHGDRHYRELRTLRYTDGPVTRELPVPKGDVLYQFRQDIANGTLPSVSWLVPPERFSDHPGSAWYGQWYLSEVLNILTKNPAVWKKTIFILTYDENDGYFDHVPPFQAPHPARPDTGKASKGLDTSLDHQDLTVDRLHKKSGAVRGNALGLGFRVPMIVASPWSRGGRVCSQVFDHTSTLRFLEVWQSHRTGRKLVESNITPWRRTVCGDLTSAFRTHDEAKEELSDFLSHDGFVSQIHQSQFRDVPRGYKALTKADIGRLKSKPRAVLPPQEPGVRPSNPLPYQLRAAGGLNAAGDAFTVRLEARKDQFGEAAAGAPFLAYADTTAGLAVRNYAAAAGGTLEDSWPLTLFGKIYSVRIHGPNGFFREFQGTPRDPVRMIALIETVTGGRVTGDLEIDASDLVGMTVEDLSYPMNRVRRNGDRWVVESSRSGGWYDVRISRPDPFFSHRFAGRVETGRMSTSDPAMA